MAEHSLQAESARAKFDEAKADYLAKRAISDAMPPESEGEDAAVDVYSDAMDHLVLNVSAPDGKGLLYKIELARERWADFAIPDAWLDALVTDVRHLTGEA
jgi:hypothetical protein